MKLQFRNFLMVTIIGVLSSTDDKWYQYRHQQCKEPSESLSLYDIASVYTQSHFEAVGYSDWMVEKVMYISCQKKGLTAIPKGLDKGVKILDLRKNSITHIKNNDFSEYTELIAILLQQNCFPANIYRTDVPPCTADFIKIDSRAFADIHNLTHLDLSDNNVKSVPENLPSSLKFLGIDLTELGPLNTTNMKQLHELQIVLFGRNCIEIAGSSLCKGNFSIEGFNFSSRNLSYLDLLFNNLKTVPSWLFTHTLVGINLQGNPIHTIGSNDFIACPHIKYLILSWTSKFDKQKMTIMHDAFTHLRDLMYLDLSGNMLTTLPDFSSNPKLSSIGLVYNCLQMSAKNPTYLTSLPLTKLEIFGNTFCDNSSYPTKTRIPIFELGDAFRNFTQLKTLKFEGYTSLTTPTVQEMFWILSYGFQYDYVGKNSLKALEKLPNLKQLSLSLSGIKYIDLSIFCNLNLSMLDLGINEIKHISENISVQKRWKRKAGPIQQPNSLKTLQYFSRIHKNYVHDLTNKHSNMLILNRNALTALPNHAFKCFPVTNYLDLSYNQINYIPNDTFADMKQLETLNLRYNPIRQIYPATQNGLAKLSTLKLNYSSFQGDFTLLFLLHTSNNITLHYGDITDNIYRLLSAYRKNSTEFRSVVSITISDIPINIYDILNNEPIFKPFPNLLQITLISAQISIPLGDNFFGGVSNLTNVTMRNCLLKQFPYKTLEALPNLRYLDLTNNYIETLNKSWFDNISNISFLILSNNFISYIEPKTLHYLVRKGLQTLDLSSNYISDIRESVMDNYTLSKLNYLDIRKNPIACDCSLTRNFGTFIRSTNSTTQQSNIAGLLPVCTDVIRLYYGGCLTCNAGGGFLSQPPSLFLYSLSNTCEESFLIVLTISFTLFMTSFISLTLICNCKSLQKLFVTRCMRRYFGPKQEEINDPEPTSVKYAYDAVVAYDTEDICLGDWVDFTMIPKLNTGFPTCKIGVLGKEDWCGVVPTVQQLLLRMEASQKTIVLLTDNFQRSPQCKYILRVLEHWVYTKGEDRCIIVTFQQHFLTGEGFQIRNKRNPLSVLNLPNLNEDSDMFLELLRNAIVAKPFRS